MPIPIGRQHSTISISSYQNVSRYLDRNIVYRRKKLKISQTALAEKAGLTRNCIQQLECHEHLPLPSTMFKLIRALDFSREEAAEFWVEIDAAYVRDKAVREGIDETCEVVCWTSD